MAFVNYFKGSITVTVTIKITSNDKVKMENKITKIKCVY